MSKETFRSGKPFALAMLRRCSLSRSYGVPSVPQVFHYFFKRVKLSETFFVCSATGRRRHIVCNCVLKEKKKKKNGCVSVSMVHYCARALTGLDAPRGGQLQQLRKGGVARGDVVQQLARRRLPALVQEPFTCMCKNQLHLFHVLLKFSLKKKIITYIPGIMADL